MDTRRKRRSTASPIADDEVNTPAIITDLSAASDSENSSAPEMSAIPPPNTKRVRLTSIEKSKPKRRKTRSSAATTTKNKFISSDEDEDEESLANQPRRKKSKTLTTPAENKKDRVYTPKPVSSLRTRVTQADGYGNSVSGVVKSLKMYNFMCHSGFYQAWHPNLNFITGENGSGKSALLTGLLIGLGAKATLTSRTKSIASLIQKGKDCARTEITLMNSGNLPEEKYGTEICIERTISKSGTSSYRLRILNKWQKCKKNELDYILLSLNIQLDNPVAILNQEVAKNFLRTKDPRDKYSLFYQGTLLAKLFDLLAASKIDIDAAEKNLNFHQNLLTSLEKTIQGLAKKLSEFENLKNFRNMMMNLHNEYVWSLVQDEENTQTGLKAKLASKQSEITVLKNKITEITEKKSSFEQETTATIESSSRAKIAELEKTLEVTRKKITRNKQSMQESKLTLRTNKNLISKKEREIGDAEETLAKVQSGSREDAENSEKEYEDKKEELTGKKIKVNSEINSLKNEINIFRNGVEKAKEETQTIQDDTNSTRRMIEIKTRTLNSLSSSSDKYQIYGEQMKRLMAKIQANHRRFKHPPRGPMASLFTLKAPKYSAIVESILGPFLTGFVVDADDAALMRNLINEVWGKELRSQSRQSQPNSKPPVIFSHNFQDKVHDISSGIARTPTGKTLIDLLEVENNDHIVINALIDFREAEKEIIFDSNQAAAEVLKDKEICPKTCRSGYTLEWYRFIPAHSNYAARALQIAAPRITFLRTSQKLQIQNLKAEIQDLESKVAELQPILEAKRSQENELQAKLAQFNMDMDKKRKALNVIERAISENERNKYKPPDVASHVEELAELREELEKLNRENEAATNHIEELKHTLVDLEKEKEEFEFEIAKIQRTLANHQENIEKNQKKIQECIQVIQRLKTKLTELESGTAPIQKSLDNSDLELTRKMATAEAQCPRVKSKRTSDQVKSEFDSIKTRITTMEKHLGNMNKLQQEHDKKKENFNNKYKEFKPLFRSFQILRTLVQNQLEFLFKKRAEITNGLCLTYQSLTSQRGYKGQMLIDHEKQELHYFICPDKSSTCKTDDAMGDNNDQHHRQNKKALVEYSLGLSGGERSFSTICFIMSLWQVMECPFYMLDEFDVFMDAFNRKASQQALIAHAKRFSKHQFFLFSPLDLVEVPNSSECTVIRLQSARPEQRQQGASPSEPNENVDPQNDASTSQKASGSRSRAKRQKDVLRETS